MKERSHKRLTQFAFDLLSTKVDYFPLEQWKNVVAQQAFDTDHVKDLEFVDVEGGIGSGGRDDPHVEEFGVYNDVPRYVDDRLGFVFGSHNLTSFNHFIDIRKGKAEAKFDDFDGYSYHHGSASKGQYEKKMGEKVDEVIQRWFNDEYVHAPGQKWYRECTPSVARYSFYADKGKYTNYTDESKERFPLAESLGHEGMGMPYSVFMPVDNLARYWYQSYKTCENHDPKDLGYVMHAIQDASIPHHASGTCGNWHGKYEQLVADRLASWIADPIFNAGVKKLFEDWNKLDDSPPNSLDISDEFVKTPHRNWSIEWLVTWMALNAYRAYVSDFQNFAKGWVDNEPSMKELTKKAAAMCMLVLYDVSILERVRKFDPGRLTIKSQQGQWCVGELHPGGIIPNSLEKFDSQAEADLCLKIIQHYGMNNKCTAGKMAYYLTNGKAPFNNITLNGQQMVPFNPSNIDLISRHAMPKGIKYVIVERGNDIIDFGTSQGDAKRTYHIIKKYSFNRYCWLGNRSNPVMQYFLYDKIGQPVPPPLPGTP